MSLINKEVNDFEVKAFQNDEFKTVKKEDILGKWSVFFFYPADFTFVCPTELEDLSNKYEEFKKVYINYMEGELDLFSKNVDSIIETIDKIAIHNK